MVRDGNPSGFARGVHFIAVYGPVVRRHLQRLVDETLPAEMVELLEKLPRPAPARRRSRDDRDRR